MIYRFTFSVSLCILSSVIGLSQSAHPSDSLELVDVFNHTGGSNWEDSWDLSQPVMSWHGITMDTTSGRIMRIDLSSNDLSDTIPDLNLPKLEVLNVAGNDINGPLPAFSSIPDIQTIKVNDNDLTGPLPDFSNCPQLSVLDAYSNMISGPLPDFSGCPNLTQIFMSNNELSGNLPDFSNSLLLERITLSGNQLSDTIPDLSHLTALRILQLRGNNLVGSIPDLQNPNLIILTLEENQLSGPIPPLSGLVNLEILDLERNNLQGTVPNFQLPKLERLDLFMNDLDSISAFDAMPLVEFINLSHNPLKPGPLPAFSLPQLERLDAINTNLSGNLEPLPGCPFLRMLLVTDNLYKGVVSDFSANPFLQDLRFSRNQLSECPPLTGLTVLSTLFMDHNKFTFEDILPNVNAASGSFVYWTQAIIKPLDSMIQAVEGDSLELHMPIDSQVTDNEYIWFHNGNPIDTLNSNSLWLSNVSIADTGIYTCQTKNPGAPNLTLLMDTIYVSIEQVDGMEQLPEAAIHLFPNPSSNFLTVQLSSYLPISDNGWNLGLYDLQGRKVIEWENLINHTLQLNVSMLPRGYYVAKLTGDYKQWQQVWVKH